MKEKNLNTAIASDADDEISLKELILKLQEWWRYLLSKWKVILLAGIIGGVLGFVYAFSKVPVYTAEVTFVLEENSGGGSLGQFGGLAGLTGINIGGGGLFQGSNIIQLYKSRSMIEKALLTSIDSPEGKEMLVERYIRINKLNEQWENNPELKKIDFAKSDLNRSRDSILTRIVRDINKNYLIVERPDNNLSLISVKVSSEDELFAKEFADHIVSTVNVFYVETKTKKSLDNILVLQQKVDSLKAAMENATYTSASTMDAIPNLNRSRQVLKIPAQLSQINAEANKAILSGLVQNLELSKIALQKETPLLQVIDSPVLPLQRDIFSKKDGIRYGSLLISSFCIFYLIIRKIFADIMDTAD